MASVYPGGLDTFATNKADATVTATDHPGHHNDLADAVNKIEAELGIDPAGAAATVKARLDASLVQAMWRSPIAVPSAADILWDGDDAAGMTTVTVTGTQTITEGRGALSVIFQDQAANDFNCLLAAKTFAVGDVWSMPLRIYERTFENFCLAGIILTDGVLSTSNAVGCYYYFDGTAVITLEAREGTLTNMATVSGGGGATAATNTTALPGMWVRIRYNAANEFIVSWSPDGITYILATTTAETFTPTHVGVFWSAFNAAGADNLRIATFGPLYKT